MNSIARDSSMKAALALALALASGSAAALGLGQLELKSKLGEPLLAEIAIVSSDPGELEQLRAGLASPETFARVGLQPPEGLIAKLRFEPALNSAGDAVIRVTSAQPIDQSVLTFLIEVEWGQGRLVREYSTLIDAPRTVSAPLQPPVDAPVLAPSDAIVRAPQAAPPATPQAETGEGDPIAAAAIPADPRPAPPPPRPAAIANAPVSPAQPVSQYGAVASGETLSQIAGGLGLGVSLDQAMVALLRANPDAFINDNINLLKQGAVLRVPQREQLESIGRAEATALVRTQVQQWRQARAAAAQPVADVGANGDVAVVGGATAQAADGARLEIVPPGASRATRAGTQSGISAGGEGEMLRQELQQTRETLAAREAELAEMQSRVAELEKLQGDQRQLLSMKDSQLAAAQQRLATAGQATPPPGEAERATSLPWVLGGIGLLLVALFAGWALRRRSATPAFRAPPAGPRPSVADAFAPAPAVSAAEPDAAPPAESPIAGTHPAAAPAAPAPGEGDSLPFWDRRERHPRPANRTPGSTAASSTTPAWHASGSTTSGAQENATATVASEAPGQERLDLARAYLDLGDHVSARLLLDEVVASGDADHSRQASRMLRELE